jgi:hypothetical protein
MNKIYPLKGVTMATMFRPKGKAAKINWKILGKPAPLNFKRSSAQEKMDKELTYQETSRVR